MLKKRERLSRREVEQVLNKGKRVRGTLFSISVIGAQEMKCAVVVSKRVAKQAVLRNKIRRRVYATLGTLQDSIGNTHVVVFCNPATSQADVSDIQKELTQLLS
jgi:ribonuclease P protein component